MSTFPSLADFEKALRLTDLTPEKLEELSHKLPWGSFGVNGDAPVTRYIADLTTDHIENILVTQFHLTAVYKKVMLYVLKQKLVLHAASVLQ